MDFISGLSEKKSGLVHFQRPQARAYPWKMLSWSPVWLFY